MASSIGLCINLESTLPEKMAVTDAFIKEAIEELGINHLLIRLPLADVDNLSQYTELASQFSEKQILVDILQDRQHIEAPELLKKQLRAIFSAFSRNFLQGK